MRLYEGARRAFGRPLETRWRFERARVVVSLDGDFLDSGPQQVGVSRDWVDGPASLACRAVAGAASPQARCPNLTSAKADHPLVADTGGNRRARGGLLA